MCLNDIDRFSNFEPGQDENFTSSGVRNIESSLLTEQFQVPDGCPPLFEEIRVSQLSETETRKSSDVACESKNNSDVLGSLLCFATISASVELVPLKVVASLAIDTDAPHAHPVSRANPPKNLSICDPHKVRTQDEEDFEISPQISTEPRFSDGRSHADTVEQPFGKILPSPGTEVILDQDVSSSSCSPLLSTTLPLSPQETEGFDEIRSLKAITSKGPDLPLDLALSSDLQGVNTTPFVKEELKEQIRTRLKKQGLPLPTVEDEEQKPDILTKEEEEKRRLRRERNRIAAAKCRRKKKARALEKRKARELILDQNIALLDEMEELMIEKRKLQMMLREHLAVCGRRDLVMLEVPQVTSIKINTGNSLSDSESLEENTAGDPTDMESSDESLDLTEDIGDGVMDSSLMDILEDVANVPGMSGESNPPELSGELLQALNILEYMDETGAELPSTSNFMAS